MRKTDRSRAEVADILERFVQGISPRNEWIDFCAYPIADPQLETIRLRSAGLPREFPPTEKGHYCNAAGMDVLCQLMSDLRQPRFPDSGQ
ncbi:MAG TPA: hypothetical protein VFT65_18545 [Candidatus Angelobacter sp.]|nr:hypothetical protein [Candidatus Angelobacter sp.]